MSDDIILYISLITSIGALITSLITHIKHSKCLGIDITTRTPPNTPKYYQTILPT